MRCVGSSPAAALQALKSRARNGETTVDRTSCSTERMKSPVENDVEPSETISETGFSATHSHPSKERDLAIFCHRVALLAERVAKPRTLLGWADFGR